ncbi:MAG: Ltp family lipoprotein, partial [Clostridia bacterium]|nr:Ltp family lipoprotein [Clostridia bacterium]
MNCPLKILCKSDIKELSAVYTGSVEAGTKITTENHNIDVTAKYNDDKTEPVYGWIIENPVTLEENKESEIKITYQDKTCILKIKCPKSITIGMRNALKTAHSYLDYTAFSYSGLIDQLKFEGYSSEEAKYAVDNCGADW